jgi:hypothetical protein
LIPQQFEVVFFFFYFYACSNFFFVFSIFSSALSHSNVHWSTVTGGVALAEALRGWSALSWRDAIFRGGSAQRIRSTETTAGESTRGFPGSWSEEKKLLLYRRKAKNAIRLVK